MQRVNIEAGDRYGMLTILAELPQEGYQRYFLCKCDCGNFKNIALASLRKKNSTKSCGCFAKTQASVFHKKHGMRNTRIYRTWINIRSRCYDELQPSYPNYGGRGIGVCDEWMVGFVPFYEWALSHGYKDDLTIDRIDMNGNYEPLNCRWVDYTVQANNKRNNHKYLFNGEMITIPEICRRLGLVDKFDTIKNRIITLGWSLESSISEYTELIKRNK